MRFNSFLWELYRRSERGVKAVEYYSHLTGDFVDSDLRAVPFTLFDEFKDQFPVTETSINVSQLVRDSVSGYNFENIGAAKAHYQNVLLEEGIPFEMTNKTGKPHVVYQFGEEESDWYDYVSAVSLGLHLAHPEFFAPYNFRCKFNQLEEIHAEFNIPLPPAPGKAMKDARGLYYLAINDVWQEFRHLHGLSPSELCAFLYDFAPQFTTPMDATDLPSPSKAWLATGGAWDYAFLESSNESTICRWSGNPCIRRGDIVVMYCVSPHKCIHSIWRACSDGFIDPFFHYHGTVWICGSVKTPAVSFAELKEHPLLSQKAAIKANLQGPHGKSPLTVEEYNAVLSLMKSKGQNELALPVIPSGEQMPDLELQTERDVETLLIEPLLIRLGYSEADWIRQMPVKMGRGERIYPDYVFGAKAKRGEESARMVLESKYQLSAHKEFMDAFYQAKSYALRLQCKIMAMAAKEGIWIFPGDNGTFDLKRVIHKTWVELVHPDGFREALTTIGKKSVFASWR